MLDEDQLKFIDPVVTFKWEMKGKIFINSKTKILRIS